MRVQLLINRLRVLQRQSPDIEASAVVSIDGLIIASALPEGVSPDRVSAMSAAMLSLGEGFCRELSRGTLEQVHIKGSNGYVILLAAGEKAVLTVLANSQSKLGLIVLELRRTAADLEQIMLTGNL
ncbi:MAG: roadblock/LC7 domain-containing protein [Anaerolineaceae bacterium]